MSCLPSWHCQCQHASFCGISPSLPKSTIHLFYSALDYSLYVCIRTSKHRVIPNHHHLSSPLSTCFTCCFILFTLHLSQLALPAVSYSSPFTSLNLLYLLYHTLHPSPLSTCFTCCFILFTLHLSQLALPAVSYSSPFTSLNLLYLLFHTLHPSPLSTCFTCCFILFTLHLSQLALPAVSYSSPFTSLNLLYLLFHTLHPSPLST